MNKLEKSSYDASLLSENPLNYLLALSVRDVARKFIATYSFSMTQLIA
jgi:hypothetical protein